MPGCFLRNSSDALDFTITTGPANKGRASLPVVIPNNPALAGQRFYAQWLVLEPLMSNPPASATTSLRMTIQ